MTIVSILETLRIIENDAVWAGEAVCGIPCTSFILSIAVLCKDQVCCMHQRKWSLGAWICFWGTLLPQEEVEFS